jgi:hypothetical protein
MNYEYTSGPEANGLDPDSEVRSFTKAQLTKHFMGMAHHIRGKLTAKLDDRIAKAISEYRDHQQTEFDQKLKEIDHQREANQATSDAELARVLSLLVDVEAQNADLKAQNAELRAQIAQLETEQASQQLASSATQRHDTVFPGSPGEDMARLSALELSEAEREITMRTLKALSSKLKALTPQHSGVSTCAGERCSAKIEKLDSKWKIYYQKLLVIDALREIEKNKTRQPTDGSLSTESIPQSPIEWPSDVESMMQGTGEWASDYESESEAGCLD